MNIKKHKSKIIIITILALGLILILFSSFKGKNEVALKKEEFSCEDYTKMLEEKLENFILNIEGIKNVNVIITLDTSGGEIYTKNSSSLNFSSITNNTSPVYVGEIYPSVRGVAIACTNGSSDETKNKITKLVSAYLGISSNRIEIVSFG
ncbi:MAG: hypothetical protein E7602_00330 [Ruminococcaceae bacterium]|nr:hypothetical protein [Oscillospiraceae bacterium]